MSLSHRLFHQHAFRKSLASESPEASRSIINISSFEVSAVVFARFAETFDPKGDQALHDIMAERVKDETFAEGDYLFD